MRLEFLEIGKRFVRADGQSLDVLEDVSFTVEPHGFVSLVGPSGCGKSTILNMLAGLLAPDRGVIRIGGRPLYRRSHRIGYVFQKPRLLNWRTVRQNVEFALRSDGVLALVGLTPFADEFPLTLSGGMQQ